MAAPEQPAIISKDLGNGGAYLDDSSGDKQRVLKEILKQFVAFNTDAGPVWQSFFEVVADIQARQAENATLLTALRAAQAENRALLLELRTHAHSGATAAYSPTAPTPTAISAEAPTALSASFATSSGPDAYITVEE